METLINRMMQADNLHENHINSIMIVIFKIVFDVVKIILIVAIMVLRIVLW